MEEEEDESNIDAVGLIFNGDGDDDNDDDAADTDDNTKGDAADDTTVDLDIVDPSASEKLRTSFEWALSTTRYTSFAVITPSFIIPFPLLLVFILPFPLLVLLAPPPLYVAATCEIKVSTNKIPKAFRKFITFCSNAKFLCCFIYHGRRG